MDQDRQHDTEDTKEENGRLATSPDLDYHDELYPRLPAELIVVIGEILIGDFAFCTTANLNLASHAIRQETLPVLYETVHHKYVESKVQPSVEFSPGYRYTKYIFRYSNTMAKTFEHELPSLVMTIHLSTRFGMCQCNRLFYDCGIHLFKPLSARTAFSILKTPLAVRSKEGGNCPAAEDRLGGRGATMPKGPSKIHDVRFVTAVIGVNLGPGAYLHRLFPNKLRHFRYHFNLRYTDINGIAFQEPEEQHLLETIMELMKLPLYQPRGCDTDAPPCMCLGDRNRQSTQIAQLLARPTLERFIESIDRAAKDLPEVLQVRIGLRVTGIRGDQDLKGLLSKFRDVFSRHVKPNQQLLRSTDIADEPPMLVALVVDHEGHLPAASETPLLQTAAPEPLKRRFLYVGSQPGEALFSMEFY